MNSPDKMDSLLKLTDDVITAVNGITSHMTTTMDGIFGNQNEHTNTDTRKPDESNSEVIGEDTPGITPII